jgi:hypothetical protein
MPKPKLSPEGEFIAAYGAAMVAAFQVLVSCLEENEAMQLHGDNKKLRGRCERYDPRAAPRNSNGDTGLVIDIDLIFLHTRVRCEPHHVHW